MSPVPIAVRVPFAIRCVLVTLAAFAAGAAPAAAAVRLQKVADFDEPVYVTAAPGDYSRLYVVEKGGRVSVVRGGVKLATPFADLSADLTSESERGLLSIAFPPDFARSGFAYAYLTDAQGDIRVDELRATSRDRADPSYRRTTIEVLHPGAANHNGGTARFGPDGYLWLATGDGGGQNDPGDNAQDPAEQLGKVLRIAPTPGGGYATPPDNPHAKGIWAIGLRNPFRFSFDRLTGDLAIGDVGQDTTEEIDYAPASANRGRNWNYGWDHCEGSYDTGTTTACSFSSVKPVIDRLQSEGWTTINGGVVVRDRSLPSLYGHYLYGDTYTGTLRSARLRLPRASDDVPLALSLPGVADIGEDALGCVYLASLAGGVYRLVETSTSATCAPPSPSPSPSPPAAADRTAPSLRIRVPRRQRVLRQRGVIAYARSSERGTVGLASRLKIGRRSYPLRYLRPRAEAGKRIRLRARLTGRAARALRRALRRRHRARVVVALRARDLARNRSRLARRTVSVRR
jgi:glucose/arabinose dehydrogenase